MAITATARRNRLVLVAAILVVVLGLLVLARGALFPFILSGILAYLLYPAVAAVESLMPWRKRWPNASRISAILLIYVAAVAVLVGALAAIVPPAFREATGFVEDVPELFERARTTIEGWNEQYTSRVPEDIRTEIEEALQSSTSVLIGAAQGLLGKIVGTVTNTVTTAIGLAIVPFLLFYLLKDREVAVEGFYSLMPPEAQRHTRNVVAIVNRVLGAYVRGQLTLMVVVGLSAFLGLFLLGIKFSVLLGIVVGVTELIPVIGPLLGAIPGVLVTLATSPEDLIWVVLLYVGIQLVENTLLVPRIQGHAVNIHPGIVMVILVVGSEVAGLWGVIVGVPLVATGRDVFKYFLQEWGDATPLEEAASAVDLPDAAEGEQPAASDSGESPAQPE